MENRIKLNDSGAVLVVDEFGKLVAFENGTSPRVDLDNLLRASKTLTGGLGISSNGLEAIGVLPIVNTPAILACSSTFNSTGQFTLVTALPAYVSNVWMFFNAVGVAGSVGGPAVSGWYYCVMSSTTVGQAYSILEYQTGEWLVRQPSALPDLLATTAGANTPTLNNHFVGPRIRVPAGTLGLNGVLRIHDLVIVSSSANAKSTIMRFGNASVCSNAAGAAITTTKTVRRIGFVYAQGATNKQIVQSNIFYGPVAADAAAATVDTAMDQYVDATVSITNAADWCGIASLFVEVLPS